MKKLIVAIVAFSALMLTGCRDQVPQAELDYNGGTETILTEKVLTEEITWETVEMETWD